MIRISLPMDSRVPGQDAGFFGYEHVELPAEDEIILARDRAAQDIALIQLANSEPLGSLGEFMDSFVFRSMVRASVFDVENDLAVKIASIDSSVDPERQFSPVASVQELLPVFDEATVQRNLTPFSREHVLKLAGL